MHHLKQLLILTLTLTICVSVQGSELAQTNTDPNQAAATAYKPTYYDNDFTYLQNEAYTPQLFGENLKQLQLGDSGILDVGGQYRARFHNELGMKGERFRSVTDDFLLTQIRLFASYEINSNIRVFLEALHADSAFHSEGIRPLDENHLDFQNALADIRLNDHTIARIGRQELIYGSRRLVGPAHWANARRTFEGFRLLYQQDGWNIDGFYTHLVPVNATEMDRAEQNRPFYGAFANYSGSENKQFDAYYFGAEDKAIGQSLHTFGGRVIGNRDDLLYEVEGGVQNGDRLTGVTQSGEGFLTLGLGRKLTDRVWQPTIWFYYDYASEHFNQLYPLAHRHLGFIDTVQRSNIASPNVAISMKPDEETDLLVRFYHFQSNSSAPVLAMGGTPSQNGGRDFGNELDVVGKRKLTPHSDLMIGWSRFYRGSKINNSRDADFFYLQYQLRF